VDFANYLISQGWTFEERTEGELSAEVLNDVDVLMFPNGMYIAFTEEEVNAVLEFLDAGGGLWMMNDYLGYEVVLNQIATRLGVAFHYDYIPDWPYVTEMLPHPVTYNVPSYRFYAGSCLEAAPPALLLARLSSGYTPFCPEKPGVLAVWESGAGRAVFQSDVTPLWYTYFPEGLPEGNLQLLDNILMWLLGPGPISVEADSWGSIKSLYR